MTLMVGDGLFIVMRGFAAVESRLSVLFSISFQNKFNEMRALQFEVLAYLRRTTRRASDSLIFVNQTTVEPPLTATSL